MSRRRRDTHPFRWRGVLIYLRFYLSSRLFRWLRERNPSRRMIAGFLPPPHIPLDTRRTKHVISRGVQQEMIDAYPRISGICIAKIIPKRVDRLLRIQLPNGVRPSLREQLLIRPPRLRKKQRVLNPPFRLIAIKIRGNNVVTPSQPRGLL